MEEGCPIVGSSPHDREAASCAEQTGDRGLPRIRKVNFTALSSLISIQVMYVMYVVVGIFNPHHQ
jgi:hypothetical protein